MKQEEGKTVEEPQKPEVGIPLDFHYPKGMEPNPTVPSNEGVAHATFTASNSDTSENS